jgi:SAM-dependent methyltransferase
MPSLDREGGAVERVLGSDGENMTASDIYADKDARYFANARREIYPLLPPQIGTVFEIGCGAGGTLDWLRREHDAKLTIGSELTEPAAARARTRVDRVIVGDVEKIELGIEPGTVDLVLALDVLEHLRDPWSVVHKLGRLLRPGGVMISSIPNVAHYSVALPLLLRSRWDYQDEGLLDRTHLRFFVERTAVELAVCSGLKLDKILYTMKLPGLIERWPRWALGNEVRWQFPKLAPHLFRFQFLIRTSAPQEGVSRPDESG